MRVLMDVAQNLIFDLGWIFFAAWTLVLTMLSVIAFRRDLLYSDPPTPPIKRR